MSALKDTRPILDNRTGYDRWSAGYDSYANATVALDERLFPPFWQDLSPRHVLEIGPGTGRHTLKLAKAGHFITAIDQSPGMLAKAKARLSNFERVQLIEGEFLSERALPLEAFDMAISALVVEHIGDLIAFFAKLARHLNSGSDFFLSEIHPSRALVGSQARFFDPETGLETLLTNYPHTEASVVQAAQGAGFVLCDAKDGVGDAALAAQNPQWVKNIGRLMLRMWHFQLTA